jgi:hypothetical protein
MTLYKLVSLILAIAFAVVGLVFMVFPIQVILFFNNLSQSLGMIQSDTHPGEIYLALAVAYMYLVTLLSIQIYRNPLNRIYPMLLANAKLASALISFMLFIIRGPYLILLVNAIIDGAIGAGFAVYCIKSRKRSSP